jgi:hypothetical protein
MSDDYVKSRISVAPEEISDDNTVTEASISVEREDEKDPDLAYQVIFLTPAELRAVYDRLRVYFDQGIWSSGSVER